MKSGSRKSTWIFAILGIFPVIWFALLTAPYLSGGLIGIVKGLPEAMDHPFSMELCKDSVKTVLLFLLAYGLGIGIYLSTRRKYRRGEEHGSAVWGDVREINRKYSEKNFLANKLMTRARRGFMRNRISCRRTRLLWYLIRKGKISGIPDIC